MSQSPNNLSRALRGIGCLAIVAIVIGGAWGIWRWATYPTVPDLATTSVEDAIAFMGEDEFNRMFEWHRRRFALGVAEKMREKPFAEIMRMMTSRAPEHERAARNIRQLEARREIGDAFLRVFLDKFFEEPPMKQKAYLTVFAYLQQTEIGENPDRVGLPTAEEFKAAMGRFLASQPPRVQGQMGQFLLDLRRQRELLGLPEPF